MIPAPSDLITPNPGALAAATTSLNTLAEADPGVAKLVAQWRTRLDHGYKHDEPARERFARDRAVAAGHSQWLVDTNLVGAILEILEAFVYAKEPDFEVKVSDSVNNTRGKQLKPVTETLRIVVSRLLRDAGLKRQGKRWVRSGQTIGQGWLKPSLTTHTEKDPVVQAEINTLQENLKRLDVVRANLADDQVADDEAAREEIKANLTALQGKMEREVANGIALDFFAADDIQVSPECGELVNYLQAPWIRVRTYKSREEAQAITGWPAELIAKANLFTQKLRHGNEAQGAVASGGAQQAWIQVQDGQSETSDGFVCFEEVWSKRDGVVYTLVNGISDRWAREPYAPCTGSRFYDVFLLGFHYVDGERHPQSDVQQLAKLQDEYGRARSNWAEHRKRSIPVTVWDAASLPPTELKKINDAEAHEHVAVNFSDPGADMRARMFRMTGAAIDPQQYNTQPITTDMEKVSGAQDAMQSGVAVEKTATEANIQNTGFGARIGTRRDELEAVLGEIGLFVAQLALQKLPEAVVVKIAGVDAVWPRLSVDEVMQAFDIDVKAGSTGKPNKQAENAAWSTLLPLVEKMITVIGNFRSQGPQMEWAAKPYIEMLTTTFELLGNKDDVERYLPHPPLPPPPDPLQALVAGLAGGGADPAAPPMAPVLGAQGSPPAAPTPTAGLPV